MSIERIKIEGLDKDPRLKDPKDKYFNKLEEFGMTRISYYMCFKCRNPYFGGLKACENMNEINEKYDEKDLMCGSCSMIGVEQCKKHGKDFIEFKCKFCCTIAQWFCWGKTHFCDSCHSRQSKGDYLTSKRLSELPKCPGKSKCPLKIEHPPNGNEFPLGCAMCRNDK